MCLCLNMDDHSAPTLLESPSLTKQSLPLKTTHLSGSYVLQLANSPLHYAAAASSPSCGIHLLDKTTLSNVHTLKGHDGGISSLRVAPTFAGSGATIFSCGKDGTVKAWDERSGNIAVQSESLCDPSVGPQKVDNSKLHPSPSRSENAQPTLAPLHGRLPRRIHCRRRDRTYWCRGIHPLLGPSTAWRTAPDARLDTLGRYHCAALPPGGPCRLGGRRCRGEGLAIGFYGRPPLHIKRRRGRRR